MVSVKAFEAPIAAQHKKILNKSNRLFKCFGHCFSLFHPGHLYCIVAVGGAHSKGGTYF